MSSRSFESFPLTEKEDAAKASPSEGLSRLAENAWNYAKEVATEHPASTILTAAAVSVVGYGLFRTAFPKAVMAGEKLGPLVHFTSREGAAGIASTQKVGGQWGIFGVPIEKAPGTSVGRLLTTLVPRDTSQKVLIEAPEAVAAFRAPIPVGPFSLARRLGGVRSSPLGSVDLAEGKFVEGEIFRNGLFRSATQGEKVRYGTHQFLLDYGVDASIYALGATAMNKGCSSMTDQQRKEAGVFKRLACRI